MQQIPPREVHAADSSFMDFSLAPPLNFKGRDIFIVTM
jgi:hypothetical protein